MHIVDFNFARLLDQINLMEKFVEAIMFNINKRANKKTLYLLLHWYPRPLKEGVPRLGMKGPVIIPKFSDQRPRWWLGGDKHVQAREIDEIEKMAEAHESAYFKWRFYDGYSASWGCYEMPMGSNSTQVMKYIKHRLGQLLLSTPKGMSVNWFMDVGIKREDGAEEWLLLID